MCSACWCLRWGVVSRFARDAGLPNQTSGSRLLAPPRAVLWGTTPLPDYSAAADISSAQVFRWTGHAPSVCIAMAAALPHTHLLPNRALPRFQPLHRARKICKLHLSSPAHGTKRVRDDTAGCCCAELPRQPGRRCASNERGGELAAQRRLPASADTQVRPFRNRALCTWHLTLLANGSESCAWRRGASCK
jgi:hypothetical protein